MTTTTSIIDTNTSADTLAKLARIAAERGRIAVSMDVDGGCDERGLRAGAFGDGGWEWRDVLRDMLSEAGFADDTVVDDEVSDSLQERFALSYDHAAERELAARAAAESDDD